jgi:hypothetical protein
MADEAENIGEEPMQQEEIEEQEEVVEEDYGLPPLQLVLDAMITCGFNHVNVRNGLTDAQRVATDLFADDFATAVYMEETDITSEVKRCAALAVAQGRILWTAPNKIKVKCFVFWVQDLYRKGLDPRMYAFLGDTTIPAIQSKMEQLQSFVSKSDQHVTAVKVQPLKQESEWYDWKPRFMSLLKGIPGIKKVPLSYVLRPNPTPLPLPLTDNMTYVEQLEAVVPHTGDSFTADNAQVQILLRSYIDPKN